jgi:two-component system chemotaxis sensor kinase CheA
MAKDPYRYFRIEATELSEQLARGVLDLEKGGFGAELVMRLLRLAHTLKGAARVVKQAEIADLAHGLEDTLSPFRDGLQAIPRENVDAALAALDTITTKIGQLPVPASPEAAPPVLDSALRIVAADLVEVDTMLEGLGEIGSELAGVRRAMDLIDRSRNLAAQIFQQQMLPQAKLKLVGEEIHALLSKVDVTMSSGTLRIDRELREVRDAAERLRLVPISSIFNTLERTARDAAHSTGKQVTFEAAGGELRIDGTILDTVQSALIQLVRNAVAHGIEPKAQRAVQGKPPGRIRVEVERRGYRAWFLCRDDGAGVDMDAVRRALVKKGVPLADTKNMDADALMAVLLKGGISTSSIVTEISGRGIGLDLVREAMQRLGGEIFAKSVPGQGTTIELAVPLSLAALDVLILENDGYVAALPLDAVRRTLRVVPTDIVHAVHGKFILYEGEQISFSSLHLGIPLTKVRSEFSSHSQAITTVVVATMDAIAAVAVGRLCGMDTVVLRTLPPSCPADPLVLGVYLDSEGNPRMVLDPEVLAVQRWPDTESEISAEHPSDEMGTPSLPILIIDDSLTTRMLESSILESAGYKVETAVCAEDGWDMAHSSSYALFLVDVEMPGMDGFTFVKNTQTDPELKSVPSVLVSSRDATEDRQRGLANGARAYIVKGEFDQVQFLELISKLVQR